MKKRSRDTAERLGLVAATMIAAAFIVSFLYGIRLPFGGEPQVPAALPERSAPDPALKPGRIQVLNGTLTTGIARAATEILRASGFDVVEFGNASLPGPADSSVVIDRTGDAALARAVAARLGIGRVVTEPDSSLLVDATVILGQDWVSARSR
jgi:hypothetical protein